MTREEAINYLKSSGFSKEQIQAIIKALGQESILDKIRAEIDDAKPPKNQMSFFRDGINCALRIIDKYRAESEEIK